MRSYRYFLIVFLLATLSCDKLSGQKKDCGAALERGYRTSSQEPLVAFLDAWHADSKPVVANILEKKLPFEQDIYKIYGAIFRPDNQVYQNTEFVIIQEEITVVVVDSDLRAEFNAGAVYPDLNPLKISEFVVKDFRPLVELEGKTILYLQDRYLACLLGFLTQDKDSLMLLRGNRYQDEECESKERQKRLQYLNTALEIIPGHWGRGWHFETQPAVIAIYLSSNLKRAIVRYTVPYYRFGEALLEKGTDRAWKIVSMKIIGIE